MRRSTREIALAAEQIAASHDDNERSFHKRIRRTLAQGHKDRRRMHKENQRVLTELRNETSAKIGEVHRRVDALTWKLGLVVGGASAVAALIEHWPWLIGH